MFTRLLVVSGATALLCTFAGTADGGLTGGEVTVVFIEPGTLDFPVPADVCEITVTALGARGGDGDFNGIHRLSAV
jgi:hypothetical protein